MTSTVQMITLISIMIAMNVALVLVQGGVTEVNPAGVQFFDVSSSPYANYAQDGVLLVDDSYLPEDESVEADTSGNIFSDTYKSMKAWTQQTLAPLKFIRNILAQPYGFLKDVGVPISIAVAVGVFWYLIAILVFVSWLMGR